jgi:hypothetical protein
MNEQARKILIFIKKYKLTHDGKAPSIRRIGCEFGLTSHVVIYALYRLVVEKKITYNGDYVNPLIEETDCQTLDTGVDGCIVNEASEKNEAVLPSVDDT